MKFLVKKIEPICGILISSYLLYLAFTNKLTLYIHPDYKGLATCMGIILFIVSFVGIFIYHNHHPNFKIIIPVLVIFFLGVFLTPTELTSNTALRRGIEDNAIVTKNSEMPIFSSFGQDTRNYDIGTWLKSFSINPEPSQYTGKQLVVIGFYHKPQELPSNLFYVSRYVITCCSIDARPVGLYVKSTDKSFAEGDWIKVSGVFDEMQLNGQNVSIIIPDSIVKTTKPQEPYIY